MRNIRTAGRHVTNKTNKQTKQHNTTNTTQHNTTQHNTTQHNKNKTKQHTHTEKNKKQTKYAMWEGMENMSLIDICPKRDLKVNHQFWHFACNMNRK